MNPEQEAPNNDSGVTIKVIETDEAPGIGHSDLTRSGDHCIIYQRGKHFQLWVIPPAKEPEGGRSLHLAESFDTEEGARGWVDAHYGGFVNG